MGMIRLMLGVKLLINHVTGGDFKGADPLNLLKVFVRAFFKKLVGVWGRSSHILPQTGDFKGVDPLNSLKIFAPTFYKKLAGFGAVPQNYLSYGGVASDIGLFIQACGSIDVR